MSWQSALGRALRDLKKEETRIARDLAEVQKRIAGLQGLAGMKAAKTVKRVRRKLSPKARAAIVRAAKKRWARYRAEKLKTS